MPDVTNDDSCMNHDAPELRHSPTSRTWEQLDTHDDALTGPLDNALGELDTHDDALTGPLDNALGDAPGNQRNASTPVPSPTPVPHLGPAGHARGVGRPYPGNRREEALMTNGTNHDSRMNHDAPEFRHLPASRTWDTNEIVALQLDRTRPPRENLVVIANFCPDMAGEDEPSQMEEAPLI